MIDKHIHENEFRLRILLTNECNKNCSYCLNDFQAKGNDYIDPDLVFRILSDYNTFSYLAGIKPVVSFSGGEPGLHPNFASIIRFARNFTDFKVQVNSNGKIHHLIWDRTGVDVRYHIEKDTNLDNRIVSGHTAVFIIQQKDSVYSLLDKMKPYHEGGMKIKTFVDYYSDLWFRTVKYPEILKDLNTQFPVSGRHTGIQENRGEGCNGCEKDCVTLKGLWVFPNNTCSPCPQRVGESYSRTQMINAYKFHLRGEQKCLKK